MKNTSANLGFEGPHFEGTTISRSCRSAAVSAAAASTSATLLNSLAATVLFPAPRLRQPRSVLVRSSCACFGLLLLFSLAAQTAVAQSLLLTGATVHTIAGETFSPGKVFIKDGKIAAVGPSLTADGAQTIDLAGQHLYPGLIALDTVLGLTEIGGVRATQD